MVVKYFPLLGAIATSIYLAVLLLSSAASAPRVPFPDSLEYENLGFHLATLGTFGEDWKSSEWLAPYVELQHDNDFKFVFEKSPGYHISTGRPPLYPALIALSYKIFGRDFLALKLINVALLSTGLGIILAIAINQGGIILATIVFCLFLLDSKVPLFSRHLLSEPLAFFLVTCLMISLKFNQTDTRKLNFSLGRLILIGIVLGLLVLVRSVLVIWIPFVWFYILMRQRHFKVPLRNIVLAAALGMMLPGLWWARNCWVLHGFFPFGAEGVYSIAGAYSGDAIQTWGLWGYRPETGAAEQIIHMAPLTPTLGKEFEQATILSNIQSDWLEWMKRNICRLPNLFMSRFGGMVFLYSTPFQKVLLFLSLPALIFYRILKTPAAFAIPVIATVTSIIMTWNERDGRYLFVAHPALYFLCSLSVMYIAKLLMKDSPATKNA